MTIVLDKTPEEACREWDRLAPLRFEQINSGSDVTYVNVLIPEIMDMAGPLNNKTVLDAGCGVGILANEISLSADSVTAIDPSGQSIALAESAFRRSNLRFVECTIEEYSTGQRGAFGIIVANMTLSCAFDLERFLASAVALMASGGKLVFSLPHPCFWPAYYGYGNDPAFVYNRESLIEAPFRISNDPHNRILSTHIHRPISAYVDAFRAAGLRLQRLKEPMPSESVAKLYSLPWTHPRYLFGACDLP